jgi:hypothetical protein
MRTYWETMADLERALKAANYTLRENGEVWDDVLNGQADVPNVSMEFRNANDSEGVLTIEDSHTGDTFDAVQDYVEHLEHNKPPKIELMDRDLTISVKRFQVGRNLVAHNLEGRLCYVHGGWVRVDLGPWGCHSFALQDVILPGAKE